MPRMSEMACWVWSGDSDVGIGATVPGALRGDTRVCQATGGSNVNGTRCHSPRSTRQCANTVP